MKRKKPVYYVAFGLKDGTVFAATPVRKSHKAKPDPEGVCTFFPYREVVPADLPDWQRAAFFAAVSTDINVRRSGWSPGWTHWRRGSPKPANSSPASSRSWTCSSDTGTRRRVAERATISPLTTEPRRSQKRFLTSSVDFPLQRMPPRT